MAFGTKLPFDLPAPFGEESTSNDLTATIQGSATVTADFFRPTNDLTATITGTATVSASLAALRNLTAVMTGSATVTVSELNQLWYDPQNDPQGGAITESWLYLLAQVGVGFDPTDDDSSSDYFIDQTYPDGWVTQYSRHLYQLMSVGVGFNDTDDDSATVGFVSQTYPDGDIKEYARYLYLLAYVIEDLRRPGFRFFHMTVSGRPRPFRPASPKTWS